MTEQAEAQLLPTRPAPWLVHMPPTVQSRAPLAALAVAAAVCLAVGASDGHAAPAAMVSILFAATVSSIAGLAFSAISGAMLFHLIDDPLQVVRVMMVCSIANQVAMSWALRRSIVWRDVWRFMMPGLAGVPCGVLLLLHVAHATYSIALGAALAAVGSWLLLRPPVRLRSPHPVLDVLVAFLGGVTGGAAAFPSGPVSIWCGMKGWDKRRQRALIQPYVLVMQVAALAVISLAHPQVGQDGGFDPLVLLYVPAGLLGTMVGIRLFALISDRQFARALNVNLIVSGLGFLS